MDTNIGVQGTEKYALAKAQSCTAISRGTVMFLGAKLPSGLQHRFMMMKMMQLEALMSCLFHAISKSLCPLSTKFFKGNLCWCCWSFRARDIAESTSASQTSEPYLPRAFTLPTQAFLENFDACYAYSHSSRHHGHSE